MQGRQLRMLVVTLEPGGVFGVHDHKDRPAIDYVLQGAVTDHRGSDAKEYHAGMTITEAQGLTHCVENKGTTPAMIVAVDVFHQPSAQPRRHPRASSDPRRSWCSDE